MLAKFLKVTVSLFALTLPDICEVPSVTSPKTVHEVCAADPTPILSLIGHTEGTDRGRGYDETLAYGRFTGGPVDLTRMTVNQVIQLQGAMLHHPANSFNSSAVGRYQIVRKTLLRLIKKLKLDGSELFDATLQNRFATELLKGRGYSKWLSGDITDTQFQANLALEWASWTNPYTGTGAYKGQNAGTKISLQQAALDAVKCR